jgi:very-short-patch-repair endonuclease
MKLPFPPVLLAIVFLLLAALLAVAVSRLKRGSRGGAVVLNPRPVMTNREQAMYWRLKETFPASVVLAQVAFSSLITSDFRHRNYFDRKTADFVLCDPAMKVQVVIELDDASHKGRGQRDAAREKLLTRAGYKVLRFANVPDQDDLKAYIQAQLAPEGRSASSRSPRAAGADKAVRGAPSQVH